MRMYDLIQKKQHGHALNKDDISYFVRGVTDATIPLEEISAFLMAIFFVGMDDRELSDLTWNMAHSGNTINLSQIKGIKIDKHSTGGVGDKTTLIVAPIVASCGVPVAKMSGKGLGFTGGTIDKLEAIPGVRTKITIEEFIQNVKNIGICIAGQTESLAPADKILYSLRDKTATVESIPLIAASIMSKKIASGADKIVLDVKVGNGAFMKSIDDALLLAQKMVAIGKNVNRQTMALLTDMSTPLGLAIGNSLEVKEAVRVLNGKGPDDLTILCIEVAANMLHLSQKGSLDACRQIAKEAIKNETALNKLLELVSAQGGDIAFIKNPDCLVSALHAIPVYSSKAGHVYSMNSEKLGMASMLLGAGRANPGDAIDYSAGLTLHKKTGQTVNKNDVLAYMHTNNLERIGEAEALIREGYEINYQMPEKKPIILGRVNHLGEATLFKAQKIK